MITIMVYKVKISRSAMRDMDNLENFLKSVMSQSGANKYINNMIAEVQSLALFADLYRPSPMADIRQYHPKAKGMVSHNRPWVYIILTEVAEPAVSATNSIATNKIVVVDRIRPSKTITK